VVDSTDGYASDKEEDKTYDDISKNLGLMITQLKGTIDRINAYKSIGKFEDIDQFADKLTNEISALKQGLDKHSVVLQQISWKGKIAHRREELKEIQGDADDILIDGNKLLEDFQKILDKANKDPENNSELIEKIDDNLDLINSNLTELENFKNELELVNDAIEEFSDLIENRDNSDLKQIIKLLKKNRDIKESIQTLSSNVYSLDSQLDELIPVRDAHIASTRKKYKAKKGDEIDELIGEFMKNSNTEVEIKRTGEGKYMIGEKKISAKVVNGNLLIRIGGGFMTMEEYMRSFGEGQLKRSARKAKKESRDKLSSNRRTRTIRMSGSTRVVGSADLMKSLR